jgi:hypothetical protein
MEDGLKELTAMKRDLFTTIVLLPRKRWDKEAADIFEYNHQTNIDSK